jgi:hypothetical protein
MRIHVNHIVRSLVMVGFVAATRPLLGYSQSKSISTDELVKRADVVVLGKVTKLKSEWNKDKSRILTLVSVEVDQVLKGQGSEKEVAITTLGGEIDGVGEIYSHSARFRSNEEVVVFAEKGPQNQLRVAGGEQGKFTVKPSETDRMGRTVNSVPLEEFTRRIKEAVRTQNPK